MPIKSLSEGSPLATTIAQIRKNLGSEQNAYSSVLDLLCNPKFGIGISRDRILVDSPIIGSRDRPDFQIWLDVPKSLRNPGDHLYAVLDGKSGSLVKDDLKRTILLEKLEKYRFPRLRCFWLYDSEIIQRWDMSPETRTEDLATQKPAFEKTWLSLKDPEIFSKCFYPITQDAATLKRALTEFSNGKIPKRLPVTDENRHEFIQSIVSVARLSSEAVDSLVDKHLVPGLAEAKTILAPLEKVYGKVSWNRDSAEDSEDPLCFEKTISGLVEKIDAKAYDHDYFLMIDNLQPYLYALRAELDILPRFPKRSGKAAAVSFLDRKEESLSAREAFIQETATLLLSRMLMIRFAEDYTLLDRIISNGGIAAFIRYADYFKKPYQALIAEAYEKARPLFRHLFERKALDWILYRDSLDFSESLLHAMWLLARWDFSTVRGDILSGIYDKFLEPRQRKALGEVYTRPELARYILKACEYSQTSEVLDPAAGSGTFLVEAFDGASNRAEELGIGFGLDDVLEVLSRLNGLDINEFSATLAKIQLLWHAIGCGPEIRNNMKGVVRSLSIEGGYDSLDTWGFPMKKGGLKGLSLDSAEEALKGRVAERAFRSRSTSQNYDIVVGNPPYVRVHRFGMSKSLLEQYSDVQHHQTDMSAFFVYRSIKWWLKDGGRLGFFLPLSITEAKYASKLRDLILKYRIREIVDLELAGNVIFHGSNIVTCILIIEKTPAQEEDSVTITTVHEGCIDEETGVVRMDLAMRVSVQRKNILLTNYLPKEESKEDSPDEEEDDSEGTDSNAILTKVKPMDIPLLEKLSGFPRLSSLLDKAWRNRKDKSKRSRTIPEGEEGEWDLCPILGYGVKIGGKSLNDSDGAPVFKGAHAFPGGVEGDPIGTWNGDRKSVDSRRFYDWESLIDRLRTFAFREISLGPSVSPHPDSGWLQNTAYLIQLKQDFPLNVYVLSRIVQWYMSKLHRSGSLSDSFRTHWFSRAICLIPVPETIDNDLVEKLNKVGIRIIGLDEEITLGERVLEQFLSGDGVHSDPLKTRTDLLGSKTIEILGGWPSETDSKDIQIKCSKDILELTFSKGLFKNQPIPTEDGKPFRIAVRDPDFLRWIEWVVKMNISEGKLPTQDRFRNLPIPKNISQSLATVDRFESRTAVQELEAAIDDLDKIVSDALGLSPDERNYISSEMRSDPFLSKIRPAWKHTAGRGRNYIVYGEDRKRY